MGRWKMLLPWRGSTVVEAAAAAALDACSRLIVVVGHRGEELAGVFAARDRVEIVRNPDWERGLFSSVRAGAAAVRSERFFVALGDMPLVGSPVYRSLLAAPPAPAVHPLYRGRRGHPVLLAAAVIPRILAAPLESNLGCVLQGVEGRDVVVDDPGTQLDLDEPADYERLARG